MKISILAITIMIGLAAGVCTTRGATAPETVAAARQATNLGGTEPFGVDLMARGAELEKEGQQVAALKFYTQAAQAGNSEGAFHAGRLSWETTTADKVMANVLRMDAGLRYTYRAATNCHPQACLSLSNAFREGRGVLPDHTQAYAWLVVAKHSDPAIPTEMLDEFVVTLDAAALERAQEMARRWLAGGWPERIAPEIVQGDARLKIYGITLGANTSVLINRKTLMVGDSAPVTPLPEARPAGKPIAASLDITCAAIGSDYVLVKVAGEAPVRLLELNTN